jgi:hypothetical protein
LYPQALVGYPQAPVGYPQAPGAYPQWQYPARPPQ